MVTKVLIAEEEDETREELVKCLTDEGFDCVEASNDIEGFDLLRRDTEITVVLSDILMLKAASLEAINVAQTGVSHNRDLEFIILTGQGGSKEAIEGLKLGAIDFLEKPIDLNHLVLVVRRAEEWGLLKRANRQYKAALETDDQVKIRFNSTARCGVSVQTVGVVGVGQNIVDSNQVRAKQERERKETAAQIIQSSKLATLGEMVTLVANELNQPLNVIRMAAGNSRRRIFKGIAAPKYLNDKLERIEKQTARAAAIIGHMRMAGREANKYPESVDPRNVVTNALDLMREQFRLAKIEIVTELAEDCSSILGHSIQMEQVILSLLTNARDAMAENDGEAKITLRVFEDGKRVYITSEDTGGGIPEDVLPRIFDRFYSTKEMSKGTGLGLSVSKRVVRDMNGTIVAENIGNGARLTITLPIVN